MESWPAISCTSLSQVAVFFGGGKSQIIPGAYFSLYFENKKCSKNSKLRSSARLRCQWPQVTSVLTLTLNSQRNRCWTTVTTRLTTRLWGLSSSSTSMTWFDHTTCNTLVTCPPRRTRFMMCPETWWDPKWDLKWDLKWDRWSDPRWIRKWVALSWAGLKWDLKWDPKWGSATGGKALSCLPSPIPLIPSAISTCNNSKGI